MKVAQAPQQECVLALAISRLGWLGVGSSLWSLLSSEESSSAVTKCIFSCSLAA